MLRKIKMKSKSLAFIEQNFEYFNDYDVVDFYCFLVKDSSRI